ncbi:cytochrome c-type biogenesis protein CcmH [Alteromonas sp. NFXS44]|uniref:cytochrome c-type biogenesis protein n=1 Tax=Alteromonas sp. NFXS44 TaxID=2818435 RepID=UPI0032DEAE14
MNTIRIALLLLFSLLPVTAISVEDNYAFDEPARRALFLKLTGELRCPMCQNQNIADSDAMIAHDMRRKVYSLMQQGKSEDEIIGYMKERYGDFVYYKPPVNIATFWLWALPVLFIAVVLFFVTRKSGQSMPVDTEEKLKRAEAMLKQDKE